ncbi:hypothetical protein M0D69_25070 [Caballeronia sp. SEWSISQ10-4 2]|uniref:hypothetical protein n=1 Tax=Caballeronia sp. SEWSISQ10-4 2 TaxID=2937438 RepID=UPI002654B1E5|nr:hypothetical protein [Caballeronia sp. SEWSISQ10-4 2]MDN7181207.1 hypothetical protein [Caballeronia sp. SEWSISQ10-4 2]
MNKEEVTSTQLSFLYVLLAIVATTALIIVVLNLFPTSTRQDVGLLIEKYRLSVQPKPHERLTFLLLSIGTPLAAMAFCASQGMADRVTAVARMLGSSGSVTVTLLCSAILAAPLFGSDSLALIVGPSTTAADDNWLFLACILGAVLWIFVATVKRYRFTQIHVVSGTVVFVLLSGAALLQLFAWRLVDIHDVTRGDGRWNTHLDAVLYPLSQVVGGRTLLADLPSQYGLFPEIVAPLFHFVKLRVASFSALFGIFQIISLCVLFWVIFTRVRSHVLRLIGGIALITVTYGTVIYFAGMGEFYYQYWPVRFLFPALSVAAFHAFSVKKTFFRASVVSAIGALGVCWNLDTGLFIVVGFGVFLITRFAFTNRGTRCSGGNEVFVRHKTAFPLYIAIHVATTICLITFFLAYLAVKSILPVHVTWLFKYQALFYELGFGMLPLPRQIHPWMSVLGIYLLASIIALRSWRDGSRSNRHELIFYLSVLGLGLFFYYEGRSHVLNLASVVWPAVLIAIILADDTLLAIKTKVLSRNQLWLPATAVAFLLTCNVAFVAHAPSMISDALARVTGPAVVIDRYVQNESDFIRAHSRGTKLCEILSARQGIYYAETGLMSPSSGPGLVEMLTTADRKELLDWILAHRLPCVFVGVGDFSAPAPGIALSDLASQYKVVARSSGGTMLYLEPK